MASTSTLDDLVKQAKSLGVWDEDLHEKWHKDEKNWHLLESVLRALVSLKTENVQLTKELHTRSLGTLKGDKMALSNLTESAPHVKKLKYKPARINRVHYNFNDGVTVPYGEPYVRRDRAIDSETDVQSFIYNILAAIASGTSKEVHFAQNRRIVGVECDILLLYGKNRIPFAAVEIKKNGAEEFVQAIFEDDDYVKKEYKGKVQGEHLTQLEQIQFFGFEKVFGALSDGNHSMITCTRTFSREDLPINSEPSRKKRSVQEMNEGNNDTSPENAINFVGQPRLQVARASRPRELYCSRYSDVKKDGWDSTVMLLTHFVKLAVNTVDRRQFRREVPLRTDLPARIIKLLPSGESEMFAHSTINFSESPNLWNCLLSDSRIVDIFLFKHLGLGQNGDCCLATTRSTHSFCAVKFFAERAQALECATTERDLWNSIYKEQLPKARLVSLPPMDDYENTGLQDACLCMPYLNPIDDNDNAREKALKNGSIRTCLELFAGKGYLHQEVRWRHLGLFRSDPRSQATTKVYLCDLGSLQKRKEGDSDAEWVTLTSEWIKKSIEHLTSTASGEDHE